jgi:hypothetical protein
MRWREKLGCEIIPLLTEMMERAHEGDAERQLRELEEPYVVRADPYAESKPIYDPIWFYGREDLMARVPPLLAQGQHVGIFGLRKVGKTSLTNQLRQRFAETPSILLDCQGITPRAESYFEAIYRGLHKEMVAKRMMRVPPLSPVPDADAFREGVLNLHDCWEKAGARGPFVVILDEIDKFFPNAAALHREETLGEYVRAFRALRGLAQTRQCLVLLVIAYRLDVNRQNLLTPAVGENPMFKSFQEEFVGFLNATETEALVREIGLWKNIVWEQAAARRVFEFTGGHPLITRLFASHVCKKGTLKNIDAARVGAAAEEIQKSLRKNEIGNYYKEGIWELLLENERRVLVRIGQAHSPAVDEAEIPSEWDAGRTARDDCI